MFKALEIGSTIDLDPRTLAGVVHSTNTLDLALGGGARCPTSAFVLSFYRADRNTYRVYVFLARMERDREGRPSGLLFRCDPADVSAAGFEGLQREAATMVQSQGFAMRQIDLAVVGPEERAALLAELPFDDKVRVPPPPVAASAVGVRPRAGSGAVQASPLADVSREISLPESQAISTLGRLLSLF